MKKLVFLLAAVAGLAMVLTACSEDPTSPLASGADKAAGDPVKSVDEFYAQGYELVTSADAQHTQQSR